MRDINFKNERGQASVIGVGLQNVGVRSKGLPLLGPPVADCSVDLGDPWPEAD